MLPLLLLLLLSTSPADRFTGTYSVESPDGPMTLLLLQSDTDVAGVLQSAHGSCRLEGEALRDEEDGEWFVEGEMACAVSGGEFDLSQDEDDPDLFYLMVLPYDPGGSVRLDLASSYLATRVDTARPELPANDPIQTQADPATRGLVGVWSTQVILNSEAGSVATQLLMEFRADGTLLDLGSRSLGGGHGVDIDTGLAPGGETAEWKTEGSVLQVRQAGTPWVPLATFQLAGDQLFLRYYDGDQKIWSRYR